MIKKLIAFAYTDIIDQVVIVRPVLGGYGGFGSGFLIEGSDENLYIITNFHVISQTDSAIIEFRNHDGEKILYDNCPVIVADENRDLAVVLLKQTDIERKLSGIRINTDLQNDGVVMSSPPLIRLCSFKLFLLILFAAFSIGCTMANAEITTTGFTDDPGTNWFKFFSNDPEDYQQAYIYPLENSEQDPFVSLEVKLRKNSGYEYGDFGIVFCSANNSYIAFVIDTMGYYSVFKSENNSITEIIDWTLSNYLLSGFGAENTLKVVQSSASNFDLYINNTLISSIIENNSVSGSSGYFVYVASENYENLSTDPVEVMYENL